MKRPLLLLLLLFGLVRLSDAKAAASEDLPPGHPGREALLALRDEVSEREFDAIFPSLVRFLKVSRSVGGSQLADSGGRPGGDDAGNGGDRNP